MKYNVFIGNAILSWCLDHNVSLRGVEEKGFRYAAEGEPEHFMTFERFSEVS